MARKQDPPAPSVPVVAVIRDTKFLADLPQLAEELEASGMTVRQVLPMSGMVTGSCAPGAIDALNRKVPRMAVEPELEAGTT